MDAHPEARDKQRFVRRRSEAIALQRQRGDEPYIGVALRRLLRLGGGLAHEKREKGKRVGPYWGREFLRSLVLMPIMAAAMGTIAKDVADQSSLPADSDSRKFELQVVVDDRALMEQNPATHM